MHAIHKTTHVAWSCVTLFQLWIPTYQHILTEKKCTNNFKLALTQFMEISKGKKWTSEVLSNYIPRQRMSEDVNVDLMRG